MNDDEFERIARSWLADGPASMSDRALRSALDEIHSTRQHRAMAPVRRLMSMGNTFRLAALAAAIMLATVVAGSRISPLGGGVGGADAPSPTTGPSTSPTPRLMTTGDWAPLEPGTYVTGDPFLVRVTFTVPAGWEGNMGGPYAVFLGTAGPDMLRFQIFNKVYADPCDASPVLLDPLPGPSVDDLVNALAGLPGLQITSPTDVTLGAYQGKQLTLGVPAGGGPCRVWELPLGATNDMLGGEQQRVLVLDIDGQRLVIDVPDSVGLTPETKAEVQAVLDSIHIEPVGGAAGSPSPAPSL